MVICWYNRDFRDMRDRDGRDKREGRDAILLWERHTAVR